LGALMDRLARDSGMDLRGVRLDLTIAKAPPLFRTGARVDRSTIMALLGLEQENSCMAKVEIDEVLRLCLLVSD
ncbi:hypothetical protein, partial [Klebsiella variicola]|uniref:hypothetical protein n=1 Tax=Klebsiella variicola TaxID=244366 RepID=UPI002730E814